MMSLRISKSKIFNRTNILKGFKKLKKLDKAKKITSKFIKINKISRN